MKDYASWPIDFILLLFILSIHCIRNRHLDSRQRPKQEEHLAPLHSPLSGSDRLFFGDKVETSKLKPNPIPP